MNVKIVVAHHTRGQLLHDSRLIHMHVGKALSTEDYGMQGDDTKDNISVKNPWYCELTALYWMWKNVDADYKGLIHYRRTFTVKPFDPLRHLFIKLKLNTRKISSLWSPYSSTGVTCSYKYSDEKEYQHANAKFLNILDKYMSEGVNIVAARPVHFYSPVRTAIGPVIGERFIILLEEIIKERHPEFYPHFMKAQMGVRFHNANMHVMDKKTHDEYCALLFDILEEHERRVVTEGYLKDISTEKCYSRMSGYLGELVTNAFVQYSMRTKKVRLLPIAFFRE